MKTTVDNRIKLDIEYPDGLASQLLTLLQGLIQSRGVHPYLASWPTPLLNPEFPLASRWSIQERNVGRGLDLDPCSRSLPLRCSPW